MKNPLLAIKAKEPENSLESAGGLVEQYTPPSEQEEST
jgi:hypothetical protein